MQRSTLFIILMTLGLGAALFGAPPEKAAAGKSTRGNAMNAKPYDIRPSLSAFAPVTLECDLSFLSEKDRLLLGKLTEAARLMDEIYLRQLWSRNPEVRAELAKASDPHGKALYDFFLLNFGPWDTLNHGKPFYGQTLRPKGGSFYPEDLSAADFERWIREHPADEAAFKSNFTVIRRTAGAGLEAVPYSREYREYLEPAAKLLQEAADLAESPSLKRFLSLRARDFLSNEYFESDTAWMDVSGTPIEAVIGPYEVYADELLGCKASFEAFVCVRNPGESAKLEKFKAHLTDLEKNLPLDDIHQNFSRGKESPLLVVDEICTGGDARPGVQTSAFNLPNDERVREAKGSKKVMLRNVMQAKFQKSLIPIAATVLAPEQRQLVNFQSYFDEILLHEICHGLGPGKISVKGKSTTVGAELRDLYAAIEECKADITGVWSLFYLMDQGVLPQGEDKLAATYLAGLFRAVRFGIGEAHGLGVMMQYNYLKKKGVIRYEARTKTYAVDLARFREGVKALAREVLTVEATGNYDGARSLIESFGKMPPEVSATLERLKPVPVDIRPTFPAL